MNKELLKTGVQEFINTNISADIVSVLLKKSIFDKISSQELAQQIEAKNSCRKKLPTWFNTPKIYYPKKLNIEQTSSEITARYKSQIIDGKSLLDLTGGFGVDSYFFSHKIEEIVHCETNENLSEIATYNFNILDAGHIKTIATNGLDFLKQYRHNFDWIYVDPSRRNDLKGKVFLLADCLPNVPEYLDLLFEKSSKVLIKTSPLLDISIGISELKFVKEIHIVSIKNEMKELLWVLQKGFKGEVLIKTIDLKKITPAIFDFQLSEEKSAISDFAMPKQDHYLYEPNTAILKSGAFKLVGARLQLKKLHQHTHLYTSPERINFPGRRFKINQIISYTKKNIRQLQLEKANITTRNFKESVASLRKKYKIKDGGNLFLFFTRNENGNFIVLNCSKL
ncbi:MAG: class I SAM-dependent methyltransferase [Flavobacteriaceae bacterium]